MKILYIHQYFKTPEEGGAIRSYYLARGLVDHGHEVVMLTSHNKSAYEEKDIDGIKVIYLPVPYENRMGFIQRITAFLKFIFSAYRKAREIHNAGLCYATSTPLTIGLLARIIKFRLQIPYYFEVRDLWPEAPVQMGVLQNPLLKKYLYRLERKIYQNAERIIALSPAIKEAIRAKALHKKIEMLPNMADVDFYKHEPKNPQLIRKYQVQNKFVITYSGAIGEANHLDYLLNHAYACQQEGMDEVLFMIVGEGKEKERLQKKTAQLQLNNLRFLHHTSKEGIKELLNISDAAYISFKNLPVLTTGSPNKFFDALAAGKLIILNFNGWIREMTESNRCGFYANPLKPKEIIPILKKFVKDPALTSCYRQNARKLAEDQFSKKIIINKLIEILQHDFPG